MLRARKPLLSMSNGAGIADVFMKSEEKKRKGKEMTRKGEG